MSYQRKHYFVVPDSYLWMVCGGLGFCGYAIYELHRGSEVGKEPLFGEFPVVQCPAGRCSEFLLDF